MTGKFIVFYGINCLGKTLQAKKLVERLLTEGHRAEYLKYAVYDLAPSGPILNEYLRQGNPLNLTPREFQIFQALNRTQYQPELIKKLEDGIMVVAEDYVGTGIAWGMGADVNKDFLQKINSHLLKEDLAILLDGERFTSGIEERHRHEKNEELTNRVRTVHQELGQENGWNVINANQGIETVHEQIWQLATPLLIK